MCIFCCTFAIELEINPPISAALAELVDALDLGSSFERSEGSSPLCRTSGHKDPIFCIKPKPNDRFGLKVQGITNISDLIVKY